MLEQLDSINWSSMQHAFGSAKDVPGNLRALCSIDADTRSNAMGNLFGTVWHQGTIYSASPYVVPFLVELLNANEISEEESIAVLLASIASGTGYYQVHGALPIKHAKNNRDIELAIQHESKIVQEARSAASPHIPLLLPYLRDPEPSVREIVARAVALYPEHFGISAEALKEVRAVETDEDAAREIEAALQQIPDA